MRNKGQLFFGGALILFGLMIAISNIFNINLWTVFWPAVLILLGLWLLFRPRLVPEGSGFDVRPFGGQRRSGSWVVADEETWTFIGDTKLDMSEAEIPLGETSIRLYGFIGDVDLRIPEGVGLSVSSIAFLNDTKIFGNKRSQFLLPVEFTTDGYAEAERKVRLDTAFFITDLDIVHS